MSPSSHQIASFRFSESWANCMCSFTAKSASSCCRSPILSRLIALRHGHRFQFASWVTLASLPLHSEVSPQHQPQSLFKPTIDSKPTDFFNSYHNYIRSHRSPILIMNPLFYTSGPAPTIKTYTVYAILNGTTLVRDTDSGRS